MNSKTVVTLGGVEFHLDKHYNRLTNVREIEAQSIGIDCKLCENKAVFYMTSGDIHLCKNCGRALKLVREFIRRIDYKKFREFAIMDALCVTGFKQTLAAKRLSMTPREIHHHIGKLGITHKNWKVNK